MCGGGGRGKGWVGGGDAGVGVGDAGAWWMGGFFR